MADVLIDGDVENTIFESITNRCGTFWKTPLIGYVIYYDIANKLQYSKTVNGGANWAVAVDIQANLSIITDAYADWQVAGDAGTKIHMAYINGITNDVRYIYLDTATDTVGGDVQIIACEGTGVMDGSPERDRNFISITKTRGGNIGVAFYYMDDALTPFYHFFTSPDGAAWTDEASPWEGTDDHLLLFPANLADNNDLWALFHDNLPGLISLKTYDDSLNSWVAIAEAPITAMGGCNTFLQMDGQVRLSDGHLIAVFWNAYNVGTADLEVWDITNAGAMAQKTNVITDRAESACCSVFINQINNDLYVCYTSGTDWTTLTKVFYQVSVNGGTNWGGETALQANAEDDEKYVSAGCMKAAWGGKFQPMWFNDDLNDLFTNSDNGISIPAGGAVAEPWNIGLVATPMSH